MNNHIVARLVVGLLPVILMTSCAGSGSPVVLPPVGPETPAPVAAGSTGQLKVYTATRDIDDGNTHYFPHTSYTIYSADGKVVKKVANRTNIHDEEPTVVELPAGTYTVLARSASHGMVKVEVVIAAGRLTTAKLE
jgi:hypothetical protein